MNSMKDFAWGVATAAFQIEGAKNGKDKGLDVWEVFTHEPDRIYNRDNADVACDHYNRYKEDIALMRKLGINSYRFSISWSRIFPDGIGRVSEDGVRFYSDIIDELLRNGIEPYVTLFHWDYPYALYRKGGWLNDESVLWFAEYARKVVELYSDRVKYFITMNEPQCFIGQGYLEAIHAPGVKLPYRDVFQMAHNVMKAHGAAVIAMREAAKREIKIGYAPTCSANYPATDSPEDIEAARRSFFACPDVDEYVMWSVAWWSDPVMLGKYPEDGLEKYKDYLPEITEEDMKLMHQPLDFYAQNIYNGREICAGKSGEPEVVERGADFPKTAIGWPITPKCLYWGPKFLTDRYGLPFYISENGMGGVDALTEDRKIHDNDRIEFLDAYLGELLRAKEDGVDVRGYFLWTLMDNFEWARGYEPRFGIVYTDYETGERIPKDSAFWYRDFIKNHSK
jgi:beta-glucosidase